VSGDAGAAPYLDGLLRATAPTRADVEAALTLGHAEALELEAERLRIQRRLDRARAARDPAFDAVIAATTGELRAVIERQQSLSGRLADVAAQFGSGARFSDRVA
jgi:hypothetical protein